MDWLVDRHYLMDTSFNLIDVLSASHPIHERFFKPLYFLVDFMESKLSSELEFKCNVAASTSVHLIRQSFLTL